MIDCTNAVGSVVVCYVVDYQNKIDTTHLDIENTTFELIIRDYRAILIIKYKLRSPKICCK